MPQCILIADDEPNIVLGLEFLFAQAGYEVVVTSNGEETLQAVARHRPDLLLLDVMLPLRNGFEVCRMLRADPAAAGLRIIMLSAKGSDGEIARGLALGANAYITKPFATRELLARVRVLLDA